MIKIKTLLVVLLIFTLTGCSNTPSDLPSPNPSEPPADPIGELIDTMSLDEKVGQLVIVGLDGYEMDDNTRQMIDNRFVGGFVLFSKNIKDAPQTQSLINSLKITNQKNKLPLFISVDEEGGLVSRLPKEFKKLPTNKKIGEKNDSDLCYKIGTLTADAIKQFGYNMNFAPVLDIFSNPKNTVIGSRAFGSNPETVSSLGIRTMQGIKDGGVVSVVKHFPGHGDTLVDTHMGLARVDYDLERLNSFELIPFKTAIDSGADAVMVAHIIMDKIDSLNPATMSYEVVTGLLRNKLGFDGVVITDDMTMGAIVKNYDIAEAAVTSINAGCDIILVCHENQNSTKVIDGIKQAVTNGVITEERLNQSLRRILKLKQKYNISDSLSNRIDIEQINDRVEEVLSEL